MKCFIITPLGEEGSLIREKAESLIQMIVPVLNEMDFEVVEPHKILESGSITRQIIEHILHDELVIANLTGLNPNVMYELAVRHMTGRPVVMLAENDTVLPFDINQQRCIRYSGDKKEGNELREKVMSAVFRAMVSKVPHNPIYDVKREKMVAGLIEQLSSEEGIDTFTRMAKELKFALGHISGEMQTWKKVRDDGSETYYICSEYIADFENLRSRHYKLINPHYKHYEMKENDAG